MRAQVVAGQSHDSIEHLERCPMTGLESDGVVDHLLECISPGSPVRAVQHALARETIGVRVSRHGPAQPMAPGGASADVVSVTVPTSPCGARAGVIYARRVEGTGLDCTPV